MSRNIKACYERIPEDLLINLLNKILFHVCCSEYEGFGHYIWEAKSAGGIVITTDGPPMNDFVHNDGFKVKVWRRKRQQMGILQLIDQRDLERVIRETMRLDDDEIAEMSRASRKAWEDNDQYFRKIINQIIEQ